MLNLDTHILIFFMDGRLKPKEVELVKNNPCGISSIVLWELAKLRQLGRVTLDTSSPNFRKVLSALHIWSIDWDVALKSTKLDIQSDPADEIIGATSIIHQASLMTRDKKLRASKLIPLA